MGEFAVSAGDPGLILLIGAVVVLVAVVAARITHQVGLPALLVFLGLGLALGEAGWASGSTTPDRRSGRARSY